jgi:hypothetical protein
MKHSRHLLLMAAALCFSATLRPSAQAPQQPQQPAPNRGVQVGVPDGRGGAPAVGRGRETGPPPGPVPRAANGRPLWGGVTAAQKGVWLPGGGGGQSATEGVTVPLQPWAQAVLKDRQANQLEPHTRCKPSGLARQFLTPYGVEIVELPELQRVYIFDIGGPHTWRTIYMDGRSHPATPESSYYGHSIGWWEGDTLVVDTVGYNEGFWLDRRGTPHTDKLHTIERFTRTDSLTIKYELTVDDPGAYTSSWSTRFNLRWEDGTELFEYQCQQANYAHDLMLGVMEKVDRTSIIVP